MSARIGYNTMEEAMAARHAARQARVQAATGHHHSPNPLDETTARALLAATGHTANGITISGVDYDDALIAIGHHAPEAFMAAAHAITGTEDDPFGLFDNLYGEVYSGEIEFAEMTRWGAEDVWHAHVIVLGHGHNDGTPGIPEASECHCIDHTWATREVPEGSDGALAVTVYQSCAGELPQARYADLFGPNRDDR
jgi:hypothetical protein